MLLTISTFIFGVIATSLYFLLTKRRRVPALDLNLDDLPDISEGLPLIAGLTNSSVLSGNDVKLYQNGSIFPAMLECIANAKSSVHLETFVWSKGKLEHHFVNLLSDKARAGVTVRVLIDSVGAMEADEEQLKRLCESGVHFRSYCRPRWWNIRRFNHRTHRKLLIVDGQIGFTFGHGVADQWLGEGQDKDHWRDTGVKVMGPAVQALQSVFFDNWIEETKAPPSDVRCFPELKPQGDVPAHVVSSATGDAISSVGLLYTLAIASARSHVYIQNPYFAPEKSVAKLLGDMVERGVEVHLMVPGKHTDSPFVRRAGCSLYRPMLERGVRIYEFEPTLIHQKIIIVDGKWVHVGSTNFDARSLALNEEVGMGFLSESMAKELRQAFENDLKRCREITLEKWMQRTLFTRVIDWVAYLLRDQL